MSEMYPGEQGGGDLASHVMKWATLCYVRRAGKTLMLHRVKKENDMHAGKWNGLGGKLLPGETPEACVIREVEEESGLRLHNPELRGMLTFPRFNKVESPTGHDKYYEHWYAFVFVARAFSGALIDSDEGVLQWVDDDRLLDLNLWPGDRVFIPWLDEPGFFSARFDYDAGRFVGYNVNFYGADQRIVGTHRASSPADVMPGSAVGVRAGEASDDESCWLCNGPVVKLHCKITCTVCGFRRDCSDP